MSYDLFALATDVVRTRAEWEKLDATAMDIIMNDADYGGHLEAYSSRAERTCF